MPRRLLRDLRWLLGLRQLPWRVALFHARARRRAAGSGDQFSLASATRPAKLAELLRLADGRRHVVELGTATGWTAISLALSDPRRRVTTFDPFDRPEREQYLKLVPAAVSARITFVGAPGEAGPRDGEPVELLYIDSSHAREDTIRELEAWRPVLGAASLIVFDDYDHPDYPGVREAAETLGLEGENCAGLLVVSGM